MKLTRLLIVVALLILGVSVALLLSAGNTPESTAADFMMALANGDASRLADIGYLEGQNHDQARDTWRETFKYSRHYAFTYRLERVLQPDPKSASVSLQVIRGRSDYPEHFELPIIKIDGKWRVDVHGINREMFPGLPR